MFSNLNVIMLILLNVHDNKKRKRNCQTKNSYSWNNKEENPSQMLFSSKKERNITLNITIT